MDACHYVSKRSLSRACAGIQNVETAANRLKANENRFFKRKGSSEVYPTMECAINRERLHPLQSPEDTAKLLNKMEESQLGFNKSLQGPYGSRRSECVFFVICRSIIRVV